jgi:hypothetical protein
MQIKSKWNSRLYAKQVHSCLRRIQRIALHLPHILNTREMQALRLMCAGILQDDTHTAFAGRVEQEPSVSLIYGHVNGRLYADL